MYIWFKGLNEQGTCISFKSNVYNTFYVYMTIKFNLEP